MNQKFVCHLVCAEGFFQSVATLLSQYRYNYQLRHPLQQHSVCPDPHAHVFEHLKANDPAMEYGTARKAYHHHRYQNLLFMTTV